MGYDDIVFLGIGFVGLIGILVVSYVYLFRKGGSLASEATRAGESSVVGSSGNHNESSAATASASAIGSARRTRRSQRNRQTGLAAMDQSAARCGGDGSNGTSTGVAADFSVNTSRSNDNGEEASSASASAGAINADGDDDAATAGDVVWNKKQMRKAEKLREKAELQQQRQEMREEESKRREGKHSKYKQKENEREAKRMAAEEAEEEERQVQEKAAQDELDKWKGMFVVENTGSNEDDVVDESQGQLQLFIDYVKGKKVIMLEELAAEFGLRTQEAINRLQALEQMGRVTGVFDDRGKFIYIAPHEMDAVAKFIRSKGRVTIAALAVESNKLIDLNESKLPRKNEQDGSPSNTVQTS